MKNADTTAAAKLLRKHGFGIVHEDVLQVVLTALNHYANSIYESEPGHGEDIAKIESRIEGEIWGILYAKRGDPMDALREMHDAAIDAAMSPPAAKGE
jgi:hypothetical protein